MTKERAEFVVKNMNKLLDQQKVVFVDCQERLNFVPRVYPDVVFGDPSLYEANGEYFVTLYIANSVYYLDEPKVCPKILTMVFESRDFHGVRTIRTITLAKRSKDKKVENNWLEFRNTLV